MKFDTMRNGYNRYQVDDAIHRFKEEEELLKRQLEAFRLQSEEDKKSYETLKKKYDNVVFDIAIKEQAAQDMARIALQEANGIICCANENADTIIKEALLHARDILYAISKLGIEAKEIKDTMHVQMEQLSKAIHGFDVPPIPSASLLKKSDE